MACEHKTVHWHLDGCNEAGWKCQDCNTNLGFSPKHDRDDTDNKIETILFWLHEHDFLYVSNATDGDSMVARVMKRCRAENAFDQISIIKFLCELELETHGPYWRAEAAKVKLHISSSLALPLDFVTSTLVVYGGKGMGKTNLASVLVEEFASNGIRFAVIDPMGVWWGFATAPTARATGSGS
jgi:hypothetical protein